MAQNGGLLEGVKVADFCWAVAGPVQTRTLADHGATVVLVEPSKARASMARATPPYAAGRPGLNRSAYFALFNTSKYSITLDMRAPSGRAIATRLIMWADVVLENFRVGTMAKWGLGYEDIKKLRPDIIMASTTNQGQSGPYAHHAGFGNQLAALAGFVEPTGWPDREPSQVYGAYTDLIAPRLGVTALLAALDYRDRTGKGQYLDLSQYETGVQFLAPAVLDCAINGRDLERVGNRSPSAAPHGVYPCEGDDRWVAIEVSREDEWRQFCRVVATAWTADPKFATFLGRKTHEDELDALVAEWTAPRSAEAVMAAMQAAGVPAGVVENGKDIFDDPQLAHRDHFWVLDHSEMGSHTCDAYGFRLSETPAYPRAATPCLGEHTEMVCREFLGMSEEEFFGFFQEGIFD